MRSIKKYVLASLFLPLLMVGDVWKSDRRGGRKLVLSLLVLLLFGSTWLVWWASVLRTSEEQLLAWGWIDAVHEIGVSGDSMLPTIESGSSISMLSPARHGLERGDIVSFRNIETGGMYYLKRLIAGAGDTVGIVNGNVYVNGQVLQEDYVLDPGQTFGNSFLGECEEVVVPDDSWLVMGDNRIVSFDSRVVGFVNSKDIDGVMKPKLRAVPGGDVRELTRRFETFSERDFVEELNTMRGYYGARELYVDEDLGNWARVRAQMIGEDLDGWKQHVLPVEAVMDGESYPYVRVHEYVTQGYLSARDIVGQIEESVFEREMFMSGDYWDVGVGVYEVEKNECRFPVVSVLLGWPEEPTYSDEERLFWVTEVEILEEWVRTLQADVEIGKYDRVELQELLMGMSEQLVYARSRVKLMDDGEWPSNEVSVEEVRYFQKSEEYRERLGVFYEFEEI